jgi:hypothetical protein
MVQIFLVAVGTPVPPTGSNQNLQVIVQYDAYPLETGWILFGAASGVIFSESYASITTDNYLANRTALVTPDEYFFIITDSASDGLSDIGNYQVYVDGSVVGSGSSFNDFATVAFSVPFA